MPCKLLRVICTGWSRRSREKDGQRSELGALGEKANLLLSPLAILLLEQSHELVE